MERNAYGRQIDSFCSTVDVEPLGRRLHGVFIRAPRLSRVGSGVDVIARLEAAHGPAAAGEAVGVRAGRLVGLCFHPELTSDAGLHAWFLAEVAGLGLPATAAARRTTSGGAAA